MLGQERVAANRSRARQSGLCLITARNDGDDLDVSGANPNDLRFLGVSVSSSSRAVSGSTASAAAAKIPPSGRPVATSAAR